ncbi:MAG: helix-turn-helix domain-containing protein [Myxococcota bacterium]
MPDTNDRRRREKEARRESILEAARSVLESRGYRQLTMDHVAQAAALSKGTLYLYFESKEELCAALAARNAGALLPHFDAALATARTGLAQVGALMMAWSEHFVSQPAQFRFMLDWMRAEAPPKGDGPNFRAYRARVNESVAKLTGAIEAGKADGSIRDDLPTYAQALQLWLSSLGIALARLQEEPLQRRLEHPLHADGLFPLHLHTTLRALATDPAEGRATAAALLTGHPAAAE